MLTSAINFLSDKRKRFQRSDTVPVFETDAVHGKNKQLAKSLLEGHNTCDNPVLGKTGVPCFSTRMSPVSGSVENLTVLYDTQCVAAKHHVAFVENLKDYVDNSPFADNHTTNHVVPFSDYSSPNFHLSHEENLESQISGYAKRTTDSRAFTMEENDTDGHVYCDREVSSANTDLLGINMPTDNLVSEDCSSLSLLENQDKTQTHMYLSKVERRVKLQRSKSSAQISNTDVRFEPNSQKTHRVRSNSNQRDPSADANIEVRREITSGHRRRRRKASRYWSERSRRSRSVNTFRTHNASICRRDTSHVTLFGLPVKGTWDNYYKISVEEGQHLLQSDACNLDGFNGYLRNHHYKVNCTKDISSSQTCALPSQSPYVTETPELPKRYKYAAVRRLRRNNSTLTWSNESSRQKIQTVQYVPTSMSAGDLFLPSTSVNRTECKHNALPSCLQGILTELFSHIERDELSDIVAKLKQFNYLRDQINTKNYDSCNEFGLCPLDVAFLTSAPQTILCLMAIGFQPGPVFTSAWAQCFENPSTKDPLKLHLARRIREAELNILTKRAELKALVAKANQYAALEGLDRQESGPAESISDNNARLAFAEVTSKENDINQFTSKIAKLVAWQKAVYRFTQNPPPPSQVRILVTSQSSVVIRISHAGSPVDRIQYDCKSSTFGEEEDNFDGSASCESELEEPFTGLSEGRRTFSSVKLDYSKIIIAYRIEWSNSPEFPGNKVRAYSVPPPVRIPSTHQPVVSSAANSHSQILPFVCTGFYELTELEGEQAIYVRVYSISVRGWSEPCYARPFGIAPSTWTGATKMVITKAQVSDGSHSRESSVRYVESDLYDKLRALKQQLDHQLLLWTIEQSNGATDTVISNSSNADDSGKRTKSPMIQRKRSFRFPFASKGIKFARQTKSGLYLALLCHYTKSVTSDNEEQGESHQIVTVDDNIPMLCITKEEYASASAISGDVNWFSKLVVDPSLGPDLQIISENLLRQPAPTNLQLRFKLLNALHQFQLAIGSSNVGTLFPEIFQAKRFIYEIEQPAISLESSSTSSKVEDSTSLEFSNSSAVVESGNNLPSSLILVLVKRVETAEECVFTSGLRWNSMNKFIRQVKLDREMLAQLVSIRDHSSKQAVNETEREGKYTNMNTGKTESNTVSPETNLIANLRRIRSISDNRQNLLPSGLYIAFVQMKAHLDQHAEILVSNSINHPYMLPVERVRHRAHVTRTEWQTVVDAASALLTKPSEYAEGEKICAKLLKAVDKLAMKMGYSEEEKEQLRLYLPEVVQISPRHSLILVFPPIDRVCIPPSVNDPAPAGFKWCSMAFFERHIGLTYDPKFYSRVYSLSSILELLVPLSNFLQRQCITDIDWTKCSERSGALQSMQQSLDVLLAGKRWLSDAIATARDRKRLNTATLNWRELSQYLKLRATLAVKEEHISKQLSLNSDIKATDQLQPSGEETGIHPHERVKAVNEKTRRHTDEVLPNITETAILQRTERTAASAPLSRDDGKPANMLRIYVEYPTGLASGTCVRVSAKLTTTVREIVELTVNRVAQTVKYKSQLQHPKWSNMSHVVSNITPDVCCLVVSAGETEYQLPNTMRPLLLRHPWRSGKFSVRLVKDGCSRSARHASPTKVYLAAVQQERIPTTQTLFYPVKTSKPRITEVCVFREKVVISPPPTVYINSEPPNTFENISPSVSHQKNER